MTARTLILALGILLTPALASPALAREGCDDQRVEDDCDAPAPKARRSYAGDATSRWFHVGGGLGAIQTDRRHEVSPIGRFVIGGGGYTFGFYGTGGLELSGTDTLPTLVQGIGGLGVHIPIPVVHPMLGFKVGGGFAATPYGPTPAVTFGGQFGLIVREFDGRVGFRVLVEPSTTSFPLAGLKSKELFFTFALVL